MLYFEVKENKFNENKHVVIFVLMEHFNFMQNTSKPIFNMSV